MLVGVLGALIGGLVFSLLGFSNTTINDSTLNLRSLGIAYVGALMLLAGFNLVQRVPVQRS